LARGFVVPSSEIYGGYSATYEYGPLGVLLADNIRKIWKRELVQRRRNMVHFDGAIVAHPKVWEASGHVERFSDPVVRDTVTGSKIRADHLVRDALGVDTSELDQKALQDLIVKNNLKSPEKNPLSPVTLDNLLVKAQLAGKEVYLRGETCQNIFVSFQQILRTSRQAIPFGVMQIGKVFRDEVSGRQFILRTREFEQMEFEFFVDPEDPKDWYAHWQEEFLKLLSEKFCISRSALRYRSQSDSEKPHYAKYASDLEVELDPDDWMELSPMNHRADWDLRRHSEYSGEDLKYFDVNSKRSYAPHVIETSFGIARLIYALFHKHLREETVSGNEETRVVLALPVELAPYKVAILPLSKKPELTSVSDRLFEELSSSISCDVDESGSIGKRYRRQDEIGTPYCVTIDFETSSDHSVTVRERDSMKQERIALSRLKEYLERR
jgi:glycyl-tRNA synthetase